MRRSKASKQEFNFKGFITGILVNCSKAVNIYKKSMFNEQHVQYVSCLLWSPYIRTAFFKFPVCFPLEVSQEKYLEISETSVLSLGNKTFSLAITNNIWKGQNHIWTSCFLMQFFIANIGSVRFFYHDVLHYVKSCLYNNHLAIL